MQCKSDQRNSLQRLFVLDPLPDPNCEFAEDLEFVRPRARWAGRGFWRRSENLGHIVGDGNLVRIHSMSGVKSGIESNYAGHHLFDWIHPRVVWFQAQCPVYFDFGSETFVLRLIAYEFYDDVPLWCVQYCAKKLISNLGPGSWRWKRAAPA